jgi:hypothetical protein
MKKECVKDALSSYLFLVGKEMCYRSIFILLF